MTRPLKIALLSFAHVHAETYARLLRERADVELVVTDPDGVSTEAEGPRGRELADRLGVGYLDGYDEVFAWGPDAVVITAETAYHRYLAERAAAAGAHILCEKPLATTVQDARAINEAAREAGVHLMTAYPVRFASSFAQLRQAISAGALGEIMGIRGTNNGKIPAGRAWFTDPELAGGGALVDHVVHCADLIGDLLSALPQTVHAVANGIIGAPTAAETAGLVTMHYDSGVIATIDCSWSRPQSAATWGGLTLEVTGTKGSCVIAPFDNHVGGNDAGGEVWLGLGEDLDALMLEEFISALAADRAPQPSGQVGLETVQVVQAARESAESGTPVRLN